VRAAFHRPTAAAVMGGSAAVLTAIATVLAAIAR
jgi:hypothetical protein